MHGVIRIRRSSFFAAAAIVLVALGAPAGAVQRTFVHSSPLGNDANAALFPPCTQAAPCRTFTVALGVTDAGGEILILDTAGYGSVTINKSIKIIGPAGVYGGVSVLGAGITPTTGIVINAGSGDDITLRGLDISGVPQGSPPTAPLPLFGIDIQNAGGVHIEKTTIGNFTLDPGACINVSVSATVRVYVDDTTLRECRTGIYANGTAVLANTPSVIVDNTRIERGRGAVVAYGVWVQGQMDVSLRNSMISRQDVGIQFDSLLPNATSHLELINTEITRSNIGLQFVNASANAHGQITAAKSQFLGNTDAVKVSNSAVGGNTTVAFADSHIAYTGNAGIQLSNSAADANTRVFLEFIRSQVSNVSTTAVDLSATNGSKTYFDMRDSTLSHATTLIKTSGNSRVASSLIRSDFRHTTTIVDHGNAFGEIRLDGSHFTQCDRDFVQTVVGPPNPTIYSLENNFVLDCTDAPGPVYITPTVILPK